MQCCSRIQEYNHISDLADGCFTNVLSYLSTYSRSCLKKSNRWFLHKVNESIVHNITYKEWDHFLHMQYLESKLCNIESILKVVAATVEKVEENQTAHIINLEASFIDRVGTLQGHHRTLFKQQEITIIEVEFLKKTFLILSKNFNRLLLLSIQLSLILFIIFGCKILAQSYSTGNTISYMKRLRTNPT